MFRKYFLLHRLHPNHSFRNVSASLMVVWQDLISYISLGACMAPFEFHILFSLFLSETFQTSCSILPPRDSSHASSCDLSCIRQAPTLCYSKYHMFNYSLYYNLITAFMSTCRKYHVGTARCTRFRMMKVPNSELPQSANITATFHGSG